MGILVQAAIMEVSIVIRAMQGHGSSLNLFPILMTAASAQQENTSKITITEVVAVLAQLVQRENLPQPALVVVPTVLQDGTVGRVPVPAHHVRAVPRQLPPDRCQLLSACAMRTTTKVDQPVHPAESVEPQTRPQPRSVSARVVLTSTLEALVA